jgi:peptidoglycan/xylan/chitin deacetylase (PgdA/CDA1 family)
MKKIYLTLDFEEDYGSPGEEKTYLCHNGSKKLIEFVKQEDLKITLFITGEITEKHTYLLEPYLKEKEYFQFEQHAYNHESVFGTSDEKLNNISKGLDSYSNFFGKKAKIYRAPFGIISKPEIDLLISNDIYYGSNFFPSYFPGRFNNLHIPKDVFMYKGTDFVEIPFSVASFFRLPIAVSYMQLLGFNIYKTFMNNLPEVINFNLHLHDLFPEEAYNKINLTKAQKIAYYRASRENYAFDVFKKAIRFFKQKTYTFALFEDILNSINKDTIQQKTYNEIFKK